MVAVEPWLLSSRPALAARLHARRRRRSGRGARWVLPRWHEAVVGQARSGLDIEVVCHYTHSKDQTLTLLADRGVTVLNDPLRPTRPVESIDRHEWRFGNRGRDAAYMADLRNVLVAWVEAETAADYFLSLDTDIILPGGALAALLEDFPGGALSPLVDLAHPCVGRTAWNFMSWLEGEPRPCPPDGRSAGPLPSRHGRRSHPARPFRHGGALGGASPGRGRRLVARCRATRDRTVGRPGSPL